MRWRRNFKLAAELIGLGFLVVGLMVGMDLGQKVTQFFSQAFGKKAEIIVEANKPLGRLPRPWLNVAQGGESAGGMLQRAVNQLKPLELEYVRLDHIYDFYNVVSKNGASLQFDWTRLDAEVDAIIKSGAKPFFALSYMPPGFAPDTVAAPDNWSDWQALVKATIEHYSGFDQKNLSDVYYEVWNEPDLFGDWKMNGTKNYLTLYEVSAQAAAAAVNVKPFKFGGPATTGMYPNWIEALLNLSEAKQLRLDFISWHRYSLNSDDFAKDVTNLTKLIAQYPQLALKERVVSEWGLDPVNNPGYDNQLAAAHTMASVTSMFNMIHKAFVFEAVDGLDPAGQVFWGRYGLLTHDLQIKPRYKVFAWLEPLGPTRIRLSGEGSWVKGLAARTEAGNLQVYLTNYDPNQSHRETVPVTIKNLSPGPKTITIERFDGPTQTKNVTLTSGTFVDNVVMGVNELVRITVLK